MTVFITVFDSRKKKDELYLKRNARRKVNFSLCGPDLVRILRQDFFIFQSTKVIDTSVFSILENTQNKTHKFVKI